MTAIGVLNIIFGTIGALLSLLVVLGGGLLAAGGAAMEAGAGGEAEGMGTMAAAGGGLIMIIGVVALIAWGALAVSGIGVLKLAPWGRMLTIVCGVALVLLNVISLMQGFSVMNVIFAAYGGLLVGLFMKADWKAAFLPGAAPVPVGDMVADADFREAA
jgi:hypothetical protein